MESLCLGVISKQKYPEENCKMVPVSWELKTFVTCEGGFNSALEETTGNKNSAKAERKLPLSSYCVCFIVMLLWLLQEDENSPHNLETEHFAVAVEWVPLLTQAIFVTVYI